MNKKIFLLMAISLVMTSCSQPEKNVPVHHYGARTSAGSLGIHTVRTNETLWSIANSYRVDLREMLDMNHLSAPYRVQVGKRLKIPAPFNYTVKSGDTLYKVSRLFDTSSTDIVRLNNLKKPYSLKAGQSLRLAPQKNQQASNQKLLKERAPRLKIETVEKEELPSQIAQVEQEEPPKFVETSQILKQQQNTKYQFIKPVSGQIISAYGPKSDGLHNDGINIKAARGDAVRASESGTVVYSGQEIEGYGKMLLIRHSHGYLTAYAHMDKILAKSGDKVKRGQVIGTVGSTGNVDTPQLHFEIRKGRDAINPKTILKI